MAVALAGSASGWGIDPDSTTWEGSYEGDVNPLDVGWQDFGGGLTSGVTHVMTEGADTFIRTTNTVPDVGQGYLFEDLLGKLDPKTNIGTNIVAGMAIEFRFRSSKAFTYVDIFASDPAGVGGGGTYRFARLVLSTSNGTLQDPAPPNTDPPSDNWDTGNINTAPAWTTYRLICDDSTWTVRKDSNIPGGDIEAQIDCDGNNDARDGYWLRFIATGSPNAEFDLDYVRWTDGVPEPPPPPVGLLFQAR